MTEHDLAMLYDWLNRSHIVEWWGGEDHCLTLTRRTARAKRFSARVHHSIHCNAEWMVDWVCPVVRCSWKRGRMVGRNRSRSTRNRTSHWRRYTTGQGLGTVGSSVVPMDPEVTKIQTDPSPSNLRRRSDVTRKRGLRGTVTTRWSSRGIKHARHSSEHAVLPNPSIAVGTCPRAGAPGRPLRN